MTERTRTQRLEDVARAARHVRLEFDTGDTDDPDTFLGHIAEAVDRLSEALDDLDGIGVDDGTR